MKILNSLLIVAAFILCALSTNAANWESTRKKGVLPNNILNLDGVFKGYSYTNTSNGRISKGGTAYMLVYPIIENSQPSGRFNIFLLYSDRTIGQVFEGYKLGGFRLGLLPVGSDEGSKYIDIKPRAVATIELKSINQKPTLIIEPTTQGSDVITTRFQFDRYSDDLWLGPTLPDGTFTAKGKTGGSVTAIRDGNQKSSVRIDNSSVQLSGTYYTNFELTGLMVMRPENISSSLNEYSDSKISGLLVSVLDERRESVILGKMTANGAATKVQLLQKR